MKLVILESYDKASDWAAKYIIKRITDFQPNSDKYFILGLCAGTTPRGLYKKLIDYHSAGKISFKYVKTFNMDEYVHLPKDNPQSYHYYMWNNFFKYVDIHPANVNLPDGNVEDLQKECDEYEQKIIDCGGIDLFIAGIGADGHIGFNEPGSSLCSRTRLKTLSHETLSAYAKYFNQDINKVPRQAISVGVGTVMESREVLIIVSGTEKALALYKAVEEGINHMWTVSAFQQHTRCIVVCDEDATLELRVKTVKYFKSLEIEDYNEYVYTREASISGKYKEFY